MRRLTFWLRSWGTLTVAVIALAFSIYAIVVDNMHYAELTRPHTQHEEIYDKLIRLDARIEDAKEYIQARHTTGDNVSDLELILVNAYSLAERAEQAWVSAEYDAADAYIRKAFELLNKIPIPISVINWWLIGGIISAVILIALIVLLIGDSHQPKGTT